MDGCEFIHGLPYPFPSQGLVMYESGHHHGCRWQGTSLVAMGAAGIDRSALIPVFQSGHSVF